MTLAELRKQEKALLEKRAKIVNDQKSLYTNAQGEGRGLNPEEQTRYDRFDEDWKAVETELRSVKDLADREEASERALNQYRTDSERNGGWHQDTTEVPTQEGKYREAFVKYFTRGAGGLSNEERSLLLKREFRGTNPQSTTAAYGGYTIPQGFFPELIKSMVDYSGVLQAARIINTDSGNVLPMPCVNDTGVSAAIVTEGTQSTVADVTFTQKQLDAYVLRTLAQASEELLMDSAFSFEDIIRDLFAERLGRGMNGYLTTGTGSSQPNGVVTASTLGKTAAGSTAFTRDEMLDLFHSVDPAYRMNASWMMNDSVLASIKKLTIGGGGGDAPLWQMSMRQGEPDTIEGKPYFINQGMASSITNAAKVMLFGDFKKYAVRMVRDVAVRRLDERYADYFLVGFLGFIRFDGELLDTAAIKHLKMAA